eukprot:768434-Hanusia_phi.AAC.4
MVQGRRRQKIRGGGGGGGGGGDRRRRQRAQARSSSNGENQGEQTSRPGSTISTTAGEAEGGVAPVHLTGCLLSPSCRGVKLEPFRAQQLDGLVELDLGVALCDWCLAPDVGSEILSQVALERRAHHRQAAGRQLEGAICLAVDLKVPEGHLAGHVESQLALSIHLLTETVRHVRVVHNRRVHRDHIRRKLPANHRLAHLSGFPLASRRRLVFSAASPREAGQACIAPQPVPCLAPKVLARLPEQRRTEGVDLPFDVVVDLHVGRAGSIDALEQVLSVERLVGLAKRHEGLRAALDEAVSRDQAGGAADRDALTDCDRLVGAGDEEKAGDVVLPAGLGRTDLLLAHVAAVEADGAAESQRNFIVCAARDLEGRTQRHVRVLPVAPQLPRHPARLGNAALVVLPQARPVAPCDIPGLGAATLCPSKQLGHEAFLAGDTVDDVAAIVTIWPPTSWTVSADTEFAGISKRTQRKGTQGNTLRERYWQWSPERGFDKAAPSCEMFEQGILDPARAVALGSTHDLLGSRGLTRHRVVDGAGDVDTFACQSRCGLLEPDARCGVNQLEPVGCLVRKQGCWARGQPAHEAVCDVDLAAPADGRDHACGVTDWSRKREVGDGDIAFHTRQLQLAKVPRRGEVRELQELRSRAAKIAFAGAGLGDTALDGSRAAGASGNLDCLADRGSIVFEHVPSFTVDRSGVSIVEGQAGDSWDALGALDVHELLALVVDRLSRGRAALEEPRDQALAHSRVGDGLGKRILEPLIEAAGLGTTVSAGRWLALNLLGSERQVSWHLEHERAVVAGRLVHRLAACRPIHHGPRWAVHLVHVPMQEGPRQPAADEVTGGQDILAGHQLAGGARVIQLALAAAAEDNGTRGGGGIIYEG